MAPTVNAQVERPKILAQIEAVRPQLGAAMRRVADFVLEHPEQVIHLSVTEVAEQAGTSEATVVRLCQLLGLKGYQDFKIRLSRSLVAPLKSLHEDITPTDTPYQMMEKVFQTTVRTLHDTQLIVDPQQLEAAVDILAAARRIEFVGVGGSGIVAHDAYHKFMKLGIPGAAHADPHNAAQVCAVLKPGDAVVAVSYSGSTRDTLEAVEIAKQSGARIVAITRYGRSPLARLADAALHTTSPESRYRSEGVCSRIAQLCLIDTLVIALYLRRRPEAEEALERSRASLSAKRL